MTKTPNSIDYQEWDETNESQKKPNDTNKSNDMNKQVLKALSNKEITEEVKRLKKICKCHGAKIYYDKDTKNKWKYWWIQIWLDNKWISDKDQDWLLELKPKEWESLILLINKLWPEWAKQIAENWKTLEKRTWLSLISNNLWPEWAMWISKMELKEWSRLGLASNKLWPKWANWISKMKFEKWVSLWLADNNLWLEWAEEISNIELQENMRLDLSCNNFWDKWADIIKNNLKLKPWVELDLSNNWITKWKINELKEWAEKNGWTVFSLDWIR